MTNNELNALVAERVMNLRNVRLFMDSNMFVYDDIRTYAINIHGKETITYQPVPIPNYANDIAAAFQVVEHFQSRGFGWRIQLEPDCKRWRVCNHDDGLFLAGWEEKHGYISVTATTAPLAICLAALDAAGATVEVRAGINMTWDISEKDHDELRSMFGV